MATVDGYIFNYNIDIFINQHKSKGDTLCIPGIIPGNNVRKVLLESSCLASYSGKYTLQWGIPPARLPPQTVLRGMVIPYGMIGYYSTNHIYY